MLYGKWRPRGFEEVVGQDHIITTLRNALATGQVAHAYLFSGPRGTGKTTTARILARALNCENLVGGEPCNQCPPCEAILRGAALDLIEMDAASNRGIEDVRELRDKIGFAPSDLKKKVYLLDEAHMLTSQAWNGLLKTIEEPPPHAVFIFATTEAHQVPATIVSRCQRYDFHRIPNDALIPRLETICKAEGFSVPYEGLQAIAIQSRGGARDAITLLEQVIARYGQSPSTDEVLASLGLVQDERSRKLAAAVVADDLGEAIALAREVADDGVDMGRFTRATVDVLRDVLLQSLRGINPGSPNAGLAATVSKEQAPAIATAIAELAKADFRLDPASPVPLEVACASALLMPVMPPSASAPIVAREAVGAPAGAPSRERPSGARSSPPEIAADVPLSEEERFMKQLASRCRMVSAPAGALLNGSCEVVSLSEEKFVLGFYFPVHMGRILNEFKGLVEAQAAEILGRPIQLEARQVERNGRPQRKAPRGGHLVEAARAIGATPIGKERD